MTTDPMTEACMDCAFAALSDDDKRRALAAVGAAMTTHYTDLGEPVCGAAPCDGGHCIVTCPACLEILADRCRSCGGDGTQWLGGDGDAETACGACQGSGRR